MALRFDIQIGADTSGAERGLRQLDQQADRARHSVDRVNDELEDTSHRSQRAHGALGRVSNAWKALGVAALAYLAINVGRQINQEIDAYTRMTNQLRTVTESQEALTRVRQRLFDVSQQTMTAFDSNVQMYARLQRATRNLGTTEDELITAMTNVNNLIRISGTTAQEASSGLIQLSQGLSSGALRGDEFRSIAENMPVLLDEWAESLGVTRAQLREMGTEGELTAEMFMNVFGRTMEDVDETVSEMSRTSDQAMTQLSNAFTRFIGEATEGTEVTETLNSLIDQFVSFLEDPQTIETFGEVISTMARSMEILVQGIEAVLPLLRSLLQLINNTLDTLARLGDIDYLIPSREPGSDPLGGEERGDYTPEGNIGLPGMHDGGVVGRDFSFIRQVNPDLFAGAQRYQRGGIAGLGPDEVPAILHRGEIVLPNRHPRDRGGSAMSTLMETNILAELVSLFDRGTITVREFRREREILEEAQRQNIQRGSEEYEQLRENIEVNEQLETRIGNLIEEQREWERVSNSLGRAFGRFASSAIRDFDNIGDAAKRLGFQIADMITQIAVIEPLERGIADAFSGSGLFSGIGDWIGGAIGGLFGGGGGGNATLAPTGLFSEGGIVGDPDNKTTKVPVAAFAGAPHFADGGIPAIVHRNEGIFTPKQMENADRLFSAMQSPVEVHIHGVTKQPEVRQQDGRLDIMLDESVANAIDRGPRTQRVLRQQYGVGKIPRR
jgi:tape measure domain-containing protein